MFTADLPIDEIQRASREPQVLTAIADLYEQLAQVVAERSPTCWNRGLCCHFGQYGHQLFVTPLELAYFIAQEGSGFRVQSSGFRAQNSGLTMFHKPSNSTCPHKIEGACGARLARPLGCRIFYCQTGTEEWQQAATERFLVELRRLHTQFRVPYAYVEWLEALRQLAAREDATGWKPVAHHTG